MNLKDVLVIDDSDPDLLYAKIIIDRAGVAEQVIPFETAMDALAYLQRPEGHNADVVLLDINMPEMDGFQFLDAYERLHADHRARAVVVMLTSSPDPLDRERAMAYSCVKGYVIKPIDSKSARSLLDIVTGLDTPL